MLFQRGVAVRIAVRIKSQPHFIGWRFLARFPRRCWRWRCPSQLFCGLSRFAEFSPEQRAGWHRSGGILLLQRFQLPFQLPQRKWHPHFGRDEECLDEEHRSKKREHAENEQSQTQPRPAFTGRVRENKRRQRVWRDVLHEPAIFAQSRKNERRFGRILPSFYWALDVSASPARMVEL